MKRICFVMALMLGSPVHAREDTLQTLADQLAARLGQSRPVKVAVLALPHHDNRPSEGPILVCERLTTLLSREKNIVVIERNHVLQALDENSLSETGRLDPDIAKLMGQILGAEILVVGTLINLSGNKTEVNVRGIRADTGHVVAAARALIDRTWGNKPVLAW